MNSYNYLRDKIKQSQNIVLTTHISCDGDGLGSELAIYYCLLKLKKNVQVIHQEPLHKRYKFIDRDSVVNTVESSPKFKPDLVLAFDTNDQRMIEPVFSHFEGQCEVIFVDHHVLLDSGPDLTENSIVDSEASSTGEMTYKLVKKLDVEIDKKIAEALYTSIAFDTHVFKFIRTSKASFEIAAKLMEYDVDVTWIHRMLFAHYSANKVKFMGLTLKDIDFSHDDKAGLLIINHKSISSANIELEEIHDFVDLILGVDTCQIAILARETSPDEFRISFRSKGKYRILTLAEKFGGGGHLLACGAIFNGSQQELTNKLKSGIDTFFN